MCSRAIIIAHGRILADGTPAELAQRSRHHNAVRLGIAGGADPNVSGRAGGVARGGGGRAGGDASGDGLSSSRAAAARWLAEIADLARDRGWTVTGLRVERGRLDDVFREITAAPPATARSPPRRDPDAQRPDHLPPRAGRLFRDAARLCVHRHLSRAGRDADVLRRRFLRARPSRSATFFTFHPWLYLVLIPALVDAAVGRGAQERHDRAVSDIADPHDRGGGRQVPRRLVFCRDRAGPDLPVLDHRQFSRRTRTTA